MPKKKRSQRCASLKLRHPREKGTTKTASLPALAAAFAHMPERPRFSWTSIARVVHYESRKEILDRAEKQRSEQSRDTISVSLTAIDNYRDEADAHGINKMTCSGLVLY